MYIQTYAQECALGTNKSEIINSLSQRKAPFMTRKKGYLLNGKEIFLGSVDKIEAKIPDPLSYHQSRNNELLLDCFKQIEDEVQDAIKTLDRERVGIVIGTSTSGVDDADKKVTAKLNGSDITSWHYQTQEMGDPSLFLAKYLNLKGPYYTVSTACSSSSRALISGLRLLKTHLCDAVIVGGADTLSRMPINGFNSLELISDDLCAPFAQERKGITIGEGAGLMLISRQKSPLKILGYGESSDAYHISAPHPQGLGAKKAILEALNRANLQACDLSYVNLHGTASVLNDKAEALVMHEIFGHKVPCSSTKYLTGHTLGASGVLELCLCALTLEHNLELIEQDFTVNHLDPALPDFGLICQKGTKLKGNIVMSNAFAFGGNNTSVILGYEG